MNGQVADLEGVTSVILHEIQGVMSLARDRWVQRLVRWLFGPSARRLASLLRRLDHAIAIFHRLPSVAPHFIPINEDPYRRMAAFRIALRHLLDGKALLIRSPQ